jgi:hypothetical protein
MTPAEILARRDLEDAEQALSRAVAARDAARAHLEAVTRRERRRESARARLRVVSPSRADAAVPQRLDAREPLPPVSGTNG